MKTKMMRKVLSVVMAIAILAASDLPYNLLQNGGRGSVVKASEATVSANETVSGSDTVSGNLAMLRAAVSSVVWVDAAAGSDTGSGADRANAVKTMAKALELVREGGAIHIVGKVSVTEDTSIGKDVRIVYAGAGAGLVVEPGISLEVGTGKTLTLQGDGSASLSPAITVRSGGSIGDGSYLLDVSNLSDANKTASAAFVLEGTARVEGSARGAVQIFLAGGEVLGAGSGDGARIVNAIINHTYNSRPTTGVNIGSLAAYNLEHTTYNFKSTLGLRFRFTKPFSMSDSELNVDVPLGGTYYGIIFATKPNVDHSTIDIKNYGSILLDLGTENIRNSTIKTDGIHTPKPKPFPTKLFESEANTARFTYTTDPGLGRIAFTHESNTYEYGLPVRHDADHSREILLPKVTLTFQSEDGRYQEQMTLIKGTSLASLSGKVSADGVAIDQSGLEALKTRMEGDFQDPVNFKMLVNGDAARPYGVSDVISEDTTVIIKPITEGVRYYLNDGSVDADKYAFVEGNGGKTSPMTLEEISALDPMFHVKSKTFMGWTLDKEGGNPATDIDPHKLTMLYGKWEDKKAFRVTYYRNSPTSASVSNPEVITTTLYVGDHLAGTLVDFNKNIRLIGEAESRGQIFRHDTKEYYQEEFGAKAGNWNYIGDYGVTNILFDDYSNLYRFQAWNTAQDGSGTYYRGGHTLTEEDFEKSGGELVLYDQWIELEKLKKADAAAIADPDRARPEIKLSGEDAPTPSDYESAQAALVIDHSQTLNYKAFLNFDNIRKELVTLWGRINEVTEWHGTMNAYFDARLDFDKDVKILFESTWQVPDKDKLAQYGVLDVAQVEGSPTQWIFTVSKDFIRNTPVTNRVGTDGNYDSSAYTFYKVELPVKILPKYDPDGGRDFQKLSFDDFMKPMVLTVYDNYGRGINGYVTRESANTIALSDKPVIIVGGDIQMNINGFEREVPYLGKMQLLKYQLKSNAYDEHVKLYPTGTVHSRYELVEETNYAKVIQTLENPATGLELDSLEGRARNHNITGTDSNNYSEPYQVGVPVYVNGNGRDQYKLVAIKVQIQRVGADGRYELNADGSPRVEEKIYADKYYTPEEGKAGSLDEGRALLAGEFDHSRIITYVMQYAIPTVEVTVNKVWLDNGGNVMQELPDTEVTAELLRDGEPTGRVAVLNKGNQFRASFDGLRMYSEEDGREYTYGVREAGVSETGTISIGGITYTSVTEGGGNAYRITNTSRKSPVVPEDKPQDTPKEETPSQSTTSESPTDQRDVKGVKNEKDGQILRARKSPKTGEDAMATLYILLLTLPLVGIPLAVKRRKAR